MTASNQPPRAALPRTIRRAESYDLTTVLAFMEATGFFRDDEMIVAREVFEEAAGKGPGGHYQSYVADEAGVPVGWVCFGPTPCTLGTFDIYWIAVSPDRQGLGIGAELTRFSETEILKRQGRLVIIETSGRAIYDPTRRFYLKLGYHEAARIADFYGPGDAKVVYTKHVTTPEEGGR
jgi:ribosomal protein S18 acetylase RimI-like enzyme